MRCLERERTERFQSAQELERALTRYVINQTERSEEMELATWIRGLFPEEAIRTEGSVARHMPSAGHERAAAVGPGSPGLAEGGAVVHRGTSLPQPPVFLPTANSGATRESDRGYSGAFRATRLGGIPDAAANARLVDAQTLGGGNNRGGHCPDSSGPVFP